MIERLENTEAVKKLFDGWEETMIYSCMQGVMGDIYVTDTKHPEAAQAYLGDFCFFAGEPCRKLVGHKQDFVIMASQSEAWEKEIEACWGERAKRVVRYAIKKNTVFDEEKLRAYAADLPEGYRLHALDDEVYEKCLANDWSKDLVSVFQGKEEYLQKGLGVVVLKGEELVAGASSYTRYREGIEIEVDTRADERRRHLATACCARLILECLKRGLYPSWDAQNWNSVCLAEKLGYEFSHEYAVYEVY